ncbi:MAG TPA: hypothetical protein VFK57_13950 [Vicinamibacterales bacterium]|nr:hypothetical protein [Vicinamibacterales bacterium]
MNHRAVAAVAAAAAIAFARPVIYIAQEVNKAAEIVAAARKAIGDRKLEGLKTFSVQAGLQRNMANTQVSSDVEIVLELPDKYLRQETPQGGGMILAGGGLSGFNGDLPLQKANAGGVPGGGMVIRMGGPGGAVMGSGEKPTPEQMEQMNKALVRNGRSEASRLMLGWFAAAHPAVNAQYTYAGEAESPDGKAYVIDVKNADGFTARLFIDQQTNLPLMVTYKAPQPRMMTAGGAPPAAASGGHVIRSQAPGGQLTEEERRKLQADAEKQIQEMQRQPPAMADYALYFEEWRESDGVKFPFRMRRATDGTTTEEWTVSRIKLNPRIDAKRFAPGS